jgi:quinolinate synthase
VNVLVHPESRHDVVTRAHLVGSTAFIVRALDAAEPGSSWAIGTGLTLVGRLAVAHPDKHAMYFDSPACFSSPMNRIDLPHLTWSLEQLVAGRVVNRVTVDPEVARWARVALDQMLALPGH